MSKKSIWIASYKNGLMADTEVMAADEAEAKRAAVASYRYRSQMSLRLKPNDIVASVRPAEDQTKFAGAQAVSEKAPETPVVNIDGFKVTRA